MTWHRPLTKPNKLYNGFERQHIFWSRTYSLADLRRQINVQQVLWLDALFDRKFPIKLVVLTKIIPLSKWLTTLVNKFQFSGVIPLCIYIYIHNVVELAYQYAYEPPTKWNDPPYMCTYIYIYIQCI